MEKLLIYELNEFPIRLLNEYILLKPNSTLAYISKQGLLKQTITSDSGELHPWSTWPTFYRGVDNSQHGLKFINQNKSFADQNYPSVWDILSIKNRYFVTRKYLQLTIEIISKMFYLSR